MRQRRPNRNLGWKCVRCGAQKHEYTAQVCRDCRPKVPRGDAIDLSGSVVDSISIRSFAGKTKSGKDTLWNCVCECGKSLQLSGRRLRASRKLGKLSCGCQPLYTWAPGSRSSGLTPRNRTHGEALYSKNHSVEYDIWIGIKNRTGNPNVKCAHNYIGRGIGICEEWKHSYETFLGYVGRRPSPDYSLGRIDNDRGYEPGNVAWETAEQQANNRRTNVWITVGDTRLTVIQWSRRLDVKPWILYKRCDRGEGILDLVIARGDPAANSVAASAA